MTIGGSASGGNGGNGGGGAIVRGGNGGNGGDGIVGDNLSLIVNGSSGGGLGGIGGIGGTSGDGGNGGNGIAGNGLSLVVNGSVSGGDGGGGGGGGNGGKAGAGIAGNGLSLIVNGSVSGGDGGTDGGGGGGGGAGIIGQNLNVIVNGAVAGGLSGDGTTRANAITFTGGTNMLELRSGFSFNSNVVASGTSALRFGGGIDAAFDLGALGTSFQGFNTLEKNGAATWTLTGRSTFAGPTTVNAGTLLIDGALAHSAFTVNAGGILSGTGNVAAVIVNDGVFAPGAPGTPGSRMTVQGNLALDATSVYRVFVDPAVVSSALVTGTATLGGATVNAQFAPGSYVARQYTILQTGGLVGTFGSVTISGLPNVSAKTFNQGKDVILELSAKLGVGVPGDLVANQRNAAAAVNNFFNSGGALPQSFLTPFGLSGDAMRNALGQASGELGASAASSTFLAWQQFFNLLFDQFAEKQDFGGAVPYATEQSEAVRLAYAAVTPKGHAEKATPIDPLATRWSMWGGSYGGSERISGNAASGSHDTTSRAYGFVGGANHQLAPGTLIGFALAGGATSFGLAQGLGSGTSDLFQASVYARQSWGAAYLMGAFGYGFQDYTLKRTVTISGIESLQADFNAHTFAGRAETGFSLGSSFAGMTPYGAVQVVSLDLPGYAERATAGTTAFALSHAGRTDTQTRSELGARFDYAIPLPDALLTLRSRTAWAHDYSEGRIARTGFLALPGTAFAVNGARPNRDAVLVSAGTELTLSSGFSLAGSFEGEFSGNSDSYAGKGALRYRW